MTGHRNVLDQISGLRELAARQHDVVRRDQLRALGVSHHHVRSHLAADRWRTFGPNVVLLTTGTPTRLQHLLARQLHCGRRSWLDGFTALECAGLLDWYRENTHVVVPHGTRIAPMPGLVVHQSRQLDAVDLVLGTPATVTPARAAIDAAGWLPTERAATGLVLAVARQGLATPEEMSDVLERVWRVRHTSILREVLSDAVGLESRAELDVYRMVLAVGFRDVRRQVWVETPTARHRIDLVITLADGTKVAIEVDGPHHDDPAQRLADAERDADLVALGYVVLHIPAVLVRTDPEAVRTRLTALWRSQRAL